MKNRFAGRRTSKQKGSGRPSRFLPRLLFWREGVCYNRRMLHRHIIESAKPSLVAIDDIIDRGGVSDWRALKARADADLSLLDKISKVCAAKIADPYAQRYHLWNHYAKRALA